MCPVHRERKQKYFWSPQITSKKYKMTLNIPITEIQIKPQQFAVHTTWNTHKSITVAPAKYSFTIQHAKQQIKSTGNQAANQDHCTYGLLSVSIAQINWVLRLVGQVLPVFYFAFHSFTFFQRCTCFRCKVYVGLCAKLQRQRY